MNHRDITGTRAGGSKFSRSVAAFMLLLFLGIQLLAVVPAWHHAVHHDTASSEHQCAVTALTSGQIDCAPAAVAVPAPVATVEAHQTFSESSLALPP